MKIDIVKLIIAVAFACLLAYLCYYICDYDDKRIVLTIGALISIVLPLGGALCVSTPDHPRGSAMMKLTAAIFAFIAVLENLIFSFVDFSMPPYIIVVGITFLTFFLIDLLIYRAKQ